MLDNNLLAFEPMEMLTDLRVMLTGLHKRYFKPKRKVRPVLEGLPEGLDPAIVNTICLDHFGEQAVAYQHVHLSGWKASGAYQLRVTTPRGNTIRLIYKDALYSNEKIPALVGLPIRPGPPEFVIYSQPPGDLARYLPVVYLAEELQPKSHYRYILEDLSLTHHTGYAHNDILAVSAMLPDLQQAINQWAASVDTGGLLAFGRPFSLALQDYAHTSLERYAQTVDDPNLQATLAHWAEIAAIHADARFFELQLTQPIHGDLNYTNVHIHNTNRHQIKLVDWEWAGIGAPYSDLVSLLKGAPDYVEHSGLQRFNKRSGLASQHTAVENERAYQWCRLERGLLDAAFLANQSMISDHKANINLPRAVSHALKHVLDTYRQLAK